MPPTRCYQCRRDFTSLHRARQHVRQLGHTEGIGFVCPVYDRTFDETAQYTHHIAIPRCVSPDPFIQREVNVRKLVYLQIAEEADDQLYNRSGGTTQQKETQSSSSFATSWQCGSCGRGACLDPVATLCGHVFCHSCIIKELQKSTQCSVCEQDFFIRLDVSRIDI
ncbi:hypothetical protein BD311DRAFT_744044 [Dichomitus squalens]|uniref:RING-type domain-containing protein n=1 Tax=Dichomitus squalens TaxID=114155 RepID=A0A4V2K264_9APHY|nr:hypothetical protein BD311DRAFT_744044 [Dichomitus squalens]